MAALSDEKYTDGSVATMTGDTADTIAVGSMRTPALEGISGFTTTGRLSSIGCASSVPAPNRVELYEVPILSFFKVAQVSGAIIHRHARPHHRDGPTDAENGLGECEACNY